MPKDNRIKVTEKIKINLRYSTQRRRVRREAQRGLCGMSENIKLKGISENIIAAAIEVHKVLGPGLLESTYEECLSRELAARGIDFERQKEVPIIYKNFVTSGYYRIDMLVENSVIVELKSVEKLDPIHPAQLLTYLRLKNLQLGLLINFNVKVLKDGIKRVVNNFQEHSMH